MSWYGNTGLNEEDRLDRAQTGHVIRRTFRLLRPYRRALLATAFVLLIYTACVESGPFIVKIAIDRGISAVHPRYRVVEVAALCYIGAALLMAISERAQILMTNRVGEAFLRDLRVRVFRHICSLSLSFFDTQPIGRLVARMTSDVDALEMLVS
jgi:ATP-binding cassette subfamily B protein